MKPPITAAQAMSHPAVFETVNALGQMVDELDKITEQVAQPLWKAEQVDEYEIRVTSPEGESWCLRRADRNDSFNNFIWRWAESMVNKGDLNAS